MLVWSRWCQARSAAAANGSNQAIDHVAFSDRRHGRVAAYNCATVAVQLYRTSDGGRSCQSLGMPRDYSYGGGPTFLSFIDDQHGWIEPVSPNGPVGELLGTNDEGGRGSTSRPDRQAKFGRPLLGPDPVCLGPVEKQRSNQRSAWKAGSAGTRYQRVPCGRVQTRGDSRPATRFGSAAAIAA